MPTKYPPAWGLNQAVKAIKDIYEIHSKERFNNELLVELLQTTKTSSNFNRRALALQGFGLLNRSEETVQLTDLAVQIVKPVAGEDGEAKLTAFRKIDVLADLITRYPNAKLPSDPNILKSVLLQSIGIQRDTIKEWYDFVIDSFKAISRVTEQITDEPVKKDETEKLPKKPEDQVGMKTSTVWLPSGRKFEFSVEEGYTSEDMEFVLNLLNLFKSSIMPKDSKSKR